MGKQEQEIKLENEEGSWTAEKEKAQTGGANEAPV